MERRWNAAPETPTAITRSFSTTGPHSVTVTLTCECADNGSQTSRFNVVSPISGSISANPSAPATGQSTTLTATVAGGVAPLSYAWDPTGSGTFTAGGASTSATYTTPGDYTARVRVTDSASPAHTQVLTRTVSVTQACLKTLDFGSPK